MGMKLLQALFFTSKLGRKMKKVIALGVLTLLAQPALSSDFFARPDRLCEALKSEGLPTQGWKPSKEVPGEFSCLTAYMEVGSSGKNGLATNVAFYVNGKQSNRADEINIVVNINNPITRKIAFQKLMSATETLLTTFGETMPQKLKQALERQAPVSLSVPLGKAELIRETGQIDSFKIVLIDKSFLEKHEATIAAATGDFEKCRAAVAKTVGFDVASIKGDGKPIQNSGFQSFSLDGKNKDMFLCEVHPGGRYKIRAALGGKFPFTFIGEGTF